MSSNIHHVKQTNHAIIEGSILPVVVVTRRRLLESPTKGVCATGMDALLSDSSCMPTIPVRPSLDSSNNHGRSKLRNWISRILETEALVTGMPFSFRAELKNECEYLRPLSDLGGDHPEVP